MDAAIVALLNCATLKDAAEQCGISKRTLLRWLRHQSFRARFDEVKRGALSQATAKLRGESGKAVDVLAAIAEDRTAAPGARVIAASRLLELALRAHETEDLQARLEALEREMEREKR